MKRPVLTIVVPCFNEEVVLGETTRQLCGMLDRLKQESLISAQSRVLYVDDGSRDRTWALIMEEHTRNPAVTGIKLARNAGHQKALLAGLDAARQKSDCVVSIDADLQDDIEAIREFILRYHEGFDIVYGVRRKRDTDTRFKRLTAIGFYKAMSAIGITLVPNHADFRLMSRRALDELARYEESNLFLRGLLPLIGFPSAKVFYDRKERFAGESKYPLRKMLSFAFEGVTSFSVKPIRLVTVTGFILFGISVLAGMGAAVEKLLGYTTPGWASLMLSLWLIGGLQLMGTGLIGEYIGKIFTEVKQRPRYAVDVDLYSETGASAGKGRDLAGIRRTAKR